LTGVERFGFSAFLSELRKCTIRTSDPARERPNSILQSKKDREFRSFERFPKEEGKSGDWDL
jgi:hypothetical protein